MMTLIAQLCTLCAVCALMQMVVGEARGGESIRIIGGLLMLHLVISSVQQIGRRLIEADGLMHIYEILIG